MRSPRVPAALLLAAAFLVSPASATARSAATYPDWPTYHGTANRAGVSTTMPSSIGTPRVVKSVQLDAAVYGSPIVVGGIVIVATENDSMYGLTPSGTVLWRSTFGPPARRSQLPCGNIDPSGITGTPVYSAQTGLVYFVVEHGNPVRHAIAAIDPRTGRFRGSRQLLLPGTSQDAMQERGALNIGGGRVWVAFGGRAGDCGNYKGRVIGLPLALAGHAVAYTVPTAREAGMWTPPGPVIDINDRVYTAVGNGASGVGDAYDYSDSVLEFDSAARLISSFSPSTWPTDNDADLDLGSQAPALVDTWVFAAGKSGNAYVLRRDHLGGIGGQVSTVPLCRSFGGTAVRKGVVYVPCSDGVRAVRISATGQMSVLWHTDAAITGSPVLGGSRVWSVDPVPGTLHGLSLYTGASLGSVAVGVTSRFATPALYGKLVIVPTLTGVTIVSTS